MTYNRIIDTHRIVLLSYNSTRRKDELSKKLQKLLEKSFSGDECILNFYADNDMTSYFLVLIL